jgi:hypothetical protein
VVNHLDQISVEELQDALDNVDGKKPAQRLLAAIAYKNGVTQTKSYPGGTVFSGGRFTAGSIDSTPTSRLSRPPMMINELEESEKHQKRSNKNSKRLFTNHLEKSVSTRRRGRRRSSSNSSRKPTAWSTRSRAVGGY